MNSHASRCGTPITHAKIQLPGEKQNSRQNNASRPDVAAQLLLLMAILGVVYEQLQAAISVVLLRDDFGNGLVCDGISDADSPSRGSNRAVRRYSRG